MFWQKFGAKSEEFQLTSLGMFVAYYTALIDQSQRANNQKIIIF